MKKLIFLISAMICFSSCIQNNFKNDLCNMDIKGSVFYVVDTIWNINEDVTDIVSIQDVVTYEFNKQGNVINECHYDSYGKLKERSITKYTEDGGKTLTKVYSTEENLSNVIFYKYADNETCKIKISLKKTDSEIEETVDLYPNKSVDHMCSVWEKEGKVIISKEFISKYNDYSTKYMVFESGEKIKDEIHYLNEDGKVIKKVDALTNKTIEEYFYENGLLMSCKSPSFILFSLNPYQGVDIIWESIYKYELDNKGNWIQQIKYYSIDDEIPRKTIKIKRCILYK